MQQVLGIDVGATGIKGNIVDLESGEFLSERKKLPTPYPSTPEQVIQTIQALVNHFDWKGKPVGIGFPSMIRDGMTYSACNIHHSWVKFPVVTFFENALKAQVGILNDADAAGLAEMQYGRGKSCTGMTLFLTLGTGIGSALFREKTLFPNIELGHLKWKDRVIEKYMSNKVREINYQSWESWGSELARGLDYLCFISNPNQIIIGGGISKKFHHFEEYLQDLPCPVYPASLQNDAGILGAALTVQDKYVL